MDLIDVLRHLQNQILENYSHDKQEELENLMTIIYFLTGVAEKCKDEKITLLMEDFHYAVAEVLMGALVKGELILPDIEKQLTELENVKYLLVAQAT